MKSSVEDSSELIDRRLMIQLTGWTEVLYTCKRALGELETVTPPAVYLKGQGLGSSSACFLGKPQLWSIASSSLPAVLLGEPEPFHDGTGLAIGSRRSYREARSVHRGVHSQNPDDKLSDDAAPDGRRNS